MMLTYDSLFEGRRLNFYKKYRNDRALEGFFNILQEHADILEEKAEQGIPPIAAIDDLLSTVDNVSEVLQNDDAKKFIGVLVAAVMRDRGWQQPYNRDTERPTGSKLIKNGNIFVRPTEKE